MSRTVLRAVGSSSGLGVLDFSWARKKKEKESFAASKKLSSCEFGQLSEDLWLVRQQEQVQQDFNQCCCLVTLLEAV